jgi:hypothetical protein
VRIIYILGILPTIVFAEPHSVKDTCTVITNINTSCYIIGKTSKVNVEDFSKGWEDYMFDFTSGSNNTAKYTSDSCKLMVELSRNPKKSIDIMRMSIDLQSLCEENLKKSF